MNTRELKFSLIWKDEKTGDIIDKRYTLDQLIANDHFDEFCDCPLLSNYRQIATRQFIGQWDNNSVGIYEGDIVDICHNDYIDELDQHVTGKVVYDFAGGYPAFDIYIRSDRAVSGYESYSDEYNSFSCPDFVIKVIGNIFQNPELLEAE